MNIEDILGHFVSNKSNYGLYHVRTYFFIIQKLFIKEISKTPEKGEVKVLISLVFHIMLNAVLITGHNLIISLIWIYSTITVSISITFIEKVIFN